MKLYLLTQTQHRGSDTYDSAIVVASSKRSAKKIHPLGQWENSGSFHYCWASGPEHVHAKYLGIASGTLKPGVILSSFNAG